MINAAGRPDREGSGPRPGRRRGRAFGLAAVICLAAVTQAQAQKDTPTPPVVTDDGNGRYALATVQGSVVRLDTRTGQITTCKNGDNGWACTITPDERAAYDAEIGRLLAANAALKAQQDPAAPNKNAETRKLEIPLPSDRDIDQAMSFLEKAWRRLMDMAGRLQRGDDGKL